jgi:hypothetical protein
MEEIRNAYNLLVQRPDKKRQFWRSRRRWKDNIKIDVETSKVWTGIKWFKMVHSVLIL